MRRVVMMRPMKKEDLDIASSVDGAASLLRIRVLEHDLLRCFVAVVDCGGFTAAATVLSRTQAAVSQQIKRLEEAVQVALFQHPRREVRLTEQGSILLTYARRMIALNDEALGALRSDDVIGKVRIGANNYYATTILPPLLARFCKSHPEVQIEMHTGVAADMAQRLGHAFDLVINVHRAGSGSGTLLRREQLHWISSMDESPHQRIPLPLALLPHGALTRELAIAALGRIRHPWHLAQESSNIAALESSAAAGLAVSVFQRSSITSSLLRLLGEEDGMPALPQVDVRLETAERYMPRAAVRLHEFLLEALLPSS